MGQDPRGGQPPSSRRKENFKEWYPWIVQAAGLVDKRYPVRGLDVKLPYGLKALRLIEARFRDEMEATEHDEIEVPSLVPRDFQIVSSKLVARLKFAREKDADFSELRADDEDGDLAKEVFWVRQGGEAEEADLPSCFLRPSSELALCALLLLYIRAHSDLPFKVFQLSNTFRVETKPRHTFLRARELSLYESHACQRSEEAATAQVEETLALASRIFSDLALPYLEVKRPSWDAAPGAWYTVAIDVIMPGGRTHQAASCHHYLDHWAKSFGIRFESEEGGRAHVHQTALAMSERVLGCVIAIHGDDRGAIFPPKVAPIQGVVSALLGAGIRARIDLRAEIRPGQKYYEWETKGVPLRIEIGPRDVQAKTAVVCGRIDGAKETVQRKELVASVRSKLGTFGEDLAAASLDRFQRMVRPLPPFEVADEGREVTFASGAPVAGFVYEAPFNGSESHARALERATGLAFLGYGLTECSEPKECAFTGTMTTNRVFLGNLFL